MKRLVLVLMLVTLLFTLPAMAQMGPLKHSATNTRYFVNPSGRPVILTGSHTWEDLTDYGTPNVTNIDYYAYLSFLKSHGQNVTILWKKDMPKLCAWQESLDWRDDAVMPWNRPGPGTASDGKPQWDLTSFNTTYFNTIYARVKAAQDLGIYVVIEVFDGADTTFTRGNGSGGGTNCGDGDPFTDNASGGQNNVNNVDDGYTSGSVGVGAFTMTTNNAVSNAEDAYVKHLIDVLNPLQNVIWEVSEETPGSSYTGTGALTFWIPHMLGLIKTYEAGGTWEGTTYPAKPLQHPVGIGAMDVNNVNDAALYGLTNADWIAPTINSNFSNQWPGSVVNTNNQGKVVFNDSDHSYDAATLLNSNGTVKDAQTRNYLWENVTAGAAGVWFMDPYLISLTSTTPVRNTCGGTISNNICTTPDTKWDNFRNELGYVQTAVSLVNLLSMTPQGSLCSTGFCLANNVASGAQFMVYTTGTGSFTVNLSTPSGQLSVYWLNTATGQVTHPANVTAGSSAQSFTNPFTNDAVLLLGATPDPEYTPMGLGWHDLGSTTALQPNGVGGAGDVCPADSGSNYDTDCNLQQFNWSGGALDPANRRMLLFGGGHGDYAGNWLGSVDLSATSAAHRLTAQTNPTGGESCPGSGYANPCSRHTYGGEGVIEGLHEMYLIGGCLSNSSCTVSSGEWVLPTASVGTSCAATTQTGPACTPAWQEVDGLMSGTKLSSFGHTDIPCSDSWNPAYGTGNNLVYTIFEGQVNMISTDFLNLVQAVVAPSVNFGGGYFEGCAISQINGYMMYAGAGLLGAVDLTTGAQVDHSSSTDCGPALTASYPSMFWYPDGINEVVIYPGSGQTVYLVDDTAGENGAWFCTAVTIAGATPPAGTSNGIFNRMKWMPQEHAAMYFPGTSSRPENADTWSLRLNADPATERSLEVRCANPGVIRCTNFTPSDFVYDNTNGPIFQDGNGSFTRGATTLIVRDTTILPVEAVVNGGGAALFTRPAQSNQNPSGNWHVCLDMHISLPSCVAQFGPTGANGKSLFVQFREWQDSATITTIPAMEAPDSNGGEGWKLNEIFDGYNVDSSCQSMGQVLQNIFFRGFHQGFQNCGSGSNFEWSTDPNGNSTSRNFENGADYNCVYNVFATCARYPANTWYTMYEYFNINSLVAQSGTTWPNGDPNNFLQTWWAPGEGQSMKQIWNFNDWIYNYQNNAGENYNRIELTNYDSRLCSATGYVLSTCSTYVQGLTRYAELIVSSNPILPPYGPTPVQGASVPSVAVPSISPVSGTYPSPQTVSITDSTGGATICYTTDGTTPTGNNAGSCTHGLQYTSSFSQPVPATVQAIGTEFGFSDSGVGSAVYTQSQVAVPVITPATGLWTSPQTVAITDATGGSTICYTTDGSTPTGSNGSCTHGTAYSGQFSSPVPATITAMGTESGFSNSATSQAVYTLVQGSPVAPAPVILVQGRTQ